MGKKKQPTEGYFAVILERRVLQGATVVCRVTSRLGKTKKAIIKNSAENLAECVLEDDWIDIDNDLATVEDISEYNDSMTPKCPQCYFPLTKKAKRVLNLGTVDD